jgi:viroplasmin and RNaseH domain-containing protein
MAKWLECKKQVNRIPWLECKKQINRFSGAQYRGFRTRQEAQRWLEGGIGY